MIRKNSGSAVFLLLSIITFFYISCGLEDYPFIYPIPQSNITQEMNDRAIIRVPTNNSGSSFTHFVIFYRIYVSDDFQPSTTLSTTFSVINPTLNSDFNSIRPYIDSDTLVNSNMDSLFQGRNFKYLLFQNAEIEAVLSDNTSPSVLGSVLEFDFSSSKQPTMVKKDSGGNIIGGPYVLWRSNGNGTYSPRPDRYFVNSEDLWKAENINPNTNADVVNKSSFSKEDRYTYAAMYIVAVGIDINSYSEIYSTPSLIHVFLLPLTW